MSVLVTPIELRGHLKLAAGAETPSLEQYLEGAEAAVESYCHRKFAEAEYTEFYSGNGLPDLCLRQYPVSAIAEVRLDAAGYFGDGPGAFNSSTLLTAGQDYVLLRDDGSLSQSGLLRRLGMSDAWLYGSSPRAGLAVPIRSAVWPVGSGNVKARYTAGYDVPDDVPDDLKLAVMTLAAEIRNGATRGGMLVQSERLGEYAVSFLRAEESASSVRQLLAPYVDRGL